MSANIANAPEQKSSPKPSTDDSLTVIGICLIAAMLTNILLEGVGHGLIAFATGAQSGLLTTVRGRAISKPGWSRQVERW